MPTTAPRALLCLAVWLPLALSSCAGADDDSPAERRLVLLISVDTLRADHVGALGAAPDLTPRIDLLAEDAVVFTRAYAPAPFTLPSVSTLLTGRYPAENGVVRNDCVLPADVPSLATTLSKLGFVTGAVVSNFVLRHVSGLARGFDAYDDRFTRVEANRNVPERTAADTTEAALVLLDQLLTRADDVFLWAHYQDPHGPYTPPAGLRERSLQTERARPDGDRELPIDESQFGLGALPAYQVIDGRRDVAFYRAGYLGEVRHLDEQVGRLLDGLVQRGLYDQALIVFTADHGEALGENDYWFAHGEYLSEAMLHVPLIVRLPGGTSARRTDTVGLHDLLPTLAPLLGAATPRGLSGRDLFGPDAATTHSSVYLSTLSGAKTPRVGLVQQGHRLVLSRHDSEWRPRLHRLGSDEVVEDEALTTQLGNALTRLFSELPLRPPSYQSDLSEADLADLRALGYFGDGQEPGDG
jgi:arylsulfatase